MEVIEFSKKKKNCAAPIRPTTCPCNIKCNRRYVQPPKVTSFAPERNYCPPAKPIDAKTTYHLSYLDMDHTASRQARPKPFKPTHSLDMAKDKFANETTNKLSYRPVWGSVKAKPIVPCRRQTIGKGRMQSTTTTRHDYIPKMIPQPEIIIPCGSIRLSSGMLDTRTTAGLSYLNPGRAEPVPNYKPRMTYCPPSEAIDKNTTQKLSYQPFCVLQKERYPWMRKPIYRPPNVLMDDQTTYSKSYMETELPSREKPVVPSGTIIFPCDGQFSDKTIYKESFLPCDTEPVIPVIPCGSISIPTQKMTCDTTNKLSYQPVNAERRDLIIPRRRNMMGDGPMQSITTTRHDYVPKAVGRPEVVIPCDNIKTSSKPFEDRTTTALSYIPPGPMEPVQNFKPNVQYCRSADKIDGDTVNKLSYQPWAPVPKQELPWARKAQYQTPKDPMIGDSIYHMSYPAPGYYIEECEPTECPCPVEQQENCPQLNISVCS
ncbi:stabilizer of axonemal microtubules 2 [Cephus cinctus]|uniref:Stabilizer of axonemal microtubules 2 n=1 Tax=Cephus cinctus TaxID=211228 RepID=A0AAJ7FVF7_CEPCN|nr:stabilizer of axonemal microtubules 2 [Cephus cinctus]